MCFKQFAANVQHGSVGLRPSDQVDMRLFHSHVYVMSSWTLNAASLTVVAQWERAGLITLRTYDRNIPTVSITYRIGASWHWSTYETPLAQRQSARLITARSGGSKPPGGILSLRVL